MRGIRTLAGVIALLGLLPVIGCVSTGTSAGGGTGLAHREQTPNKGAGGSPPGVAGAGSTAGYTEKRTPTTGTGAQTGAPGASSGMTTGGASANGSDTGPGMRSGATR